MKLDSVRIPFTGHFPSPESLHSVAPLFERVESTDDATQQRHRRQHREDRRYVSNPAFATSPDKEAEAAPLDAGEEPHVLDITA